MARGIDATLAERARRRADRGEIDRLFDRWCAGRSGSEESLDDLFTRLSKIVPGRVGAPHGRDPDNRALAIEDALVKLLEDPSRYDRRKGGLVELLARMAHDASIDLWRQERRRTSHEVAAKTDLGLAAVAPLVKNPEAQAIAKEEAQLEHERWMAVCWSPRDRGFVEALEAGDLERGLLALGIADLQADERAAARRRVVKYLHERDQRRKGRRNRRRPGGTASGGI
jgi:hypothetical protein